eukprot:1082681-Amphidinium_carterae.2
MKWLKNIKKVSRVVLPSQSRNNKTVISWQHTAYSGWVARGCSVVGRRAANLELKLDMTATTAPARFRIAPPPSD